MAGGRARRAATAQPVRYDEEDQGVSSDDDFNSDAEVEAPARAGGGILQFVRKGVTNVDFGPAPPQKTFGRSKRRGTVALAERPARRGR